MINSSYKCPLCHTSHLLNDCEIAERFIKSTHTGTKHYIRYSVSTYMDTYMYVRLCHSCAKKIKRTKTILKIIWYLIIPILLVIRGIYNSKDNSDIAALIVLYAISYLMGALINGIIIRILEKSIFDIDYEQAQKDNALLTYWEIDEYKRNHK